MIFISLSFHFPQNRKFFKSKAPVCNLTFITPAQVELIILYSLNDRPLIKFREKPISTRLRLIIKSVKFTFHIQIDIVFNLVEKFVKSRCDSDWKMFKILIGNCLILFVINLSHLSAQRYGGNGLVRF